jgi:hypothetical protein
MPHCELVGYASLRTGGLCLIAYGWAMPHCEPGGLKKASLRTGGLCLIADGWAVPNCELVGYA